MKSPAHDIAVYLAGQTGLGVFGGAADWCLNVNVEPLEPANSITVYDTGGEGLDTDEQDLARPTIQVRIRGKDYPTAYLKHEIVRDLLTLNTPLVTDNSTFVLVSMSSDIALIGRDDKDRFLLVANYRMVRTIT